MKRFRSVMISVAALLMLFGLLVTGTEAQSLYTTEFVGKFTLPFEARWGQLTLPPGEYNLYYGAFTTSGLRMVEVAHEDLGVMHGLVLPRGRNDARGEGSFLVCVLNGDVGYVRSLQMAEVGESIEFARPHGVDVNAWIVAGKKTPNSKAKLAEMRISVVPVK